MKEENSENEVNIENASTIPIPKESRILLNKRLITEDPLKPYKRIKKNKTIVTLILIIVFIVAVTYVIYKFGIIKWMIIYQKLLETIN